MRTYGRINGAWVEVDTDENGYDDAVMLTTLVQCLKLAPGESPFYAQYGIPEQSSVISQIIPTFYVMRLQTQFSQYFSSLAISLVSSDPPTYKINVMTKSGSQIITEVAL